MDLTGKQKRFCDEYLIDFNATQAAIRSGYSVKTAYSIGDENLRKPEIQEYIKNKQQRVSNRLDISQERILKELASIAFSDVRQFYDESGALKSIKDLADEDAASLAGLKVDELWEVFGEDRKQTGVTKEIKRWDKIKAIETINKMLGYNAPDKKELTGRDGEPLYPSSVVLNLPPGMDINLPSNTDGD